MHRTSSIRRVEQGNVGPREEEELVEGEYLSDEEIASLPILVESLFENPLQNIYYTQQQEKAKAYREAMLNGATADLKGNKCGFSR